MRRVAVIGGGPAGLMAARLLARDHPGWQIDVYERLAPDDTFGFGVGLTRGLLSALGKAAPEIRDDLVRESTNFSSAAFWLPTGIAELPSYHAGAISRARLLQLLLDRARQAGVEVHIGASASAAELAADADLVIAADGASSASREGLASEFGTRDEIGRGWFIWCGAEMRLEGNVFMPVETEHGVFVAHSYPYAADCSTFVIETDAETLERAGCLTESFDDEGDSDETSLAYLSEAFQGLLGGGSFVGNRSRWMHFRTVRCERWHHENIVLLGDAAATAHPSLGSGTKLALEGAIALATAMEPVGSREPASRLAEFERTLRPNVERLQDTAHRSQLWWESFPSRMHLAPARIAFAYMSRAGAVSLAELRKAAPRLVGEAVADFAGVPSAEVPGEDLPDWILELPLSANGSSLPGRLIDDGVPAAELEVECADPWSPDGQALVSRARQLVDGGSRVLTLTGRASRGALLDRLALGERLRAEAGAVVAVACPKQRLGDGIDGLIAGRADLLRVADDA